MYKLIDVSRWQGTIDWDKVKKSDVDGVIIKAGGSNGGYYTDADFEKNYYGAKKAKLLVGAYYYTGDDFNTEKSGEKDAAHFCKIIKGKTFDLPVYADVEECSNATKATVAFGKYMEAHGYFFGVYASDISGFKDKLNLSKVKRFTLWVARYGKKPTYVKKYDVWQAQSDGRVDGISGRVDIDYCYRDFPKEIKRDGLNGYKKPYGGALPELGGRGYLCCGDTGENVRRLQAFLNWSVDAGLEEDGIYGAKTEAAVKKFQRKYKLDADGIFGPKSLAKAQSVKR